MQIKLLTLNIIFMIAVALLCGCTAESSTQLSAVSLNSPQEKERVAFSEAMNKFEIYVSEGLLSKNNMTIHFVTGDDVNLTGMAGIWTLGVCQNNMSSLFVYNNGGWRQRGWDGAFTDETIDLNEILSPTEIYAMDQTSIRDAISSSGSANTHLELSGNIYSVIARSDHKISRLNFDAHTGELI